MAYSEAYKVSLVKCIPEETVGYAVFGITITFNDFKRYYPLYMPNEGKYTTELPALYFYFPNELQDQGISNLIVFKTIEYLEMFTQGRFLSSQFEEFMTRRLPDNIYFIYHIHCKISLEGFSND